MNKSRLIEGLYATERDRLVRQVARRVGSEATASDLVQDVFLRLWEKAVFWQGSSAAFLTRCARNAAIDHLRSERVRNEALSNVAAEQHGVLQPFPLDGLAFRDDLSDVDRALAALPRQTRHIFLLNRIHGRTFIEIAEEFGISERAVAKHMAKALGTCERALRD